MNSEGNSDGRSQPFDTKNNDSKQRLIIALATLTLLLTSIPISALAQVECFKDQALKDRARIYQEKKEARTIIQSLLPTAESNYIYIKDAADPKLKVLGFREWYVFTNSSPFQEAYKDKTGQDISTGIMVQMSSPQEEAGMLTNYQNSGQGYFPLSTQLLLLAKKEK